VDIVTAMAGIGLLVGGLIGFAWYVFGRASDHMSGMYRAATLDWPRGVQEDDPPPAWSWRSGAAAERGSEARPRVTPEPVAVPTAVAGHVARGSSRRRGRW
jgi:hypothetical protein